MEPHRDSFHTHTTASTASTLQSRSNGQPLLWSTASYILLLCAVAQQANGLALPPRSPEVMLEILREARAVARTTTADVMCPAGYAHLHKRAWMRQYENINYDVERNYDVESCKRLCESSGRAPHCVAFEYEVETGACNLNKAWSATTPEQELILDGTLLCKLARPVGESLPPPRANWTRWTKDAMMSRTTVRLPDDGGTMYFYVHIPKAGGASFSVDAMNRFLPKSAGFLGREDCYKKLLPIPAMAKAEGVDSRIITFFRNPQEQVLSMYHECKQSPWGQKHFNIPSLRDWLEHFSHGSTADDFGCYNPSNIQTRALTCTDNLHHVTRRDVRASEDAMGLSAVYVSSGKTMAEKTEVSEAIASLASGIDFVGITGYYHESMCLFAAWTTQKLPEGCDRNKPEAWDKLGLSHETHGLVYDTNVANLELEEQAMIDDLTRDDVKLYDVALLRFKEEVRQLESRYGVRILLESQLVDQTDDESE